MVRVLVIDDESDVRALIKLMLSGLGYDVVPIVSTQLSDIDHQQFDLIITDMMMPVVDGVDVIQRLQRLGSKVPIIAISGAPWKHEYGPLDIAAKLGVQFVIAKPFRRAELLEMVDECLKNPTTTSRRNPAGRLA
jgi:two-component system cell cycle response regulator CpdR